MNHNNNNNNSTGSSSNDITQANGGGQQQGEENNGTLSSSSGEIGALIEQLTGGNPGVIGGTSALNTTPTTQNIQQSLLSSQIAGLLNSSATSSAAAPTFPWQLPNIMHNNNNINSSILPPGNLPLASSLPTMNQPLQSITQPQVQLMAQPQLQLIGQLTAHPQLQHQFNINSILPGYVAPSLSMLTGASLSSTTPQVAHLAAQQPLQLQNTLLGAQPLQLQNILLAAQPLQLYQNSGLNAGALLTTLSSSTAHNLGAGISPQAAGLNSNNNPSLAASAQAQYQLQGSNNTSRLAIPSDITCLDPVHNFLRSQCIEVFVATKDDMTAPGRGARPTMIGQVGLRCHFCKNTPKKAKQAVCFPSKRETIFESVRNYQRTHMKECSCIPEQVKAHYNSLTEQGGKKTHKYMKAYYAEAASELGIVDTLHGLLVGGQPNTSGVPLENLQAVIDANKNPSQSSSFWNSYSSGKDKSIQLRKFEHIASDATRGVIRGARTDPTVLVYTEDFGPTANIDYLLFHQVIPFAPPAASLERRGHDADIFGFCCKHCVRRAGDGTVIPNTRADFRVDLTKLPDNNFFQKMLNHFMNCPDVPQDVKNAFDELKRLAWESGTTPKRGSRKRFVEKIWERTKKYYGLKSDSSEEEGE